ncbi:DUF1002 domain-containing protein [Paucilactobacillus nenjiangensis]|uniref:DUF1002 domain-containing protein n=1 Tax=Paucilactobacillus nenjiangensis TaxID=1296540 RepID=UPI0010F7AFEF|nr:DUF1002 domain-containing protein [Paucilactobacillus nenjiangensis]
MKFIKQIAIAAVLLIASVYVAIGSSILTVHADTQAVQTTALSKSYVVYGAGMASSAKSTVDSALGVTSSYTSLTSTANDYATYISSDGTTDSAMISSVAISPASSGTGVKVNIAKYDGNSNITKVTAQQYAMVATMAGVNDVIITVTANQSVTGEAALAGVYKALATDGISLSTQNTTAANNMLDATQSAIDQNSDDSKYSGKLMAAVGDVSSGLAKSKQEDGTTATQSEVKTQLEAALKKYGIDDSTPTTSITLIVNALIQVQKAPVSSTKSYISNVSDLADSLKNSAGNAMSKLSDFANSADGRALMSKYGNIFQQIWNKIVLWIQELIAYVQTLV